MSGWGSLLSTAATKFIGPQAGALVNFGSGIFDKIETDKNAKKTSSAYYAALANQQQMSQLATRTAAQRTAFEEALKTRAMTLTGDLGTSMRAAQSGMGAMPQFDQGRIDRDYQTTKATMMTDFNDMLKLVDSQGRASQMERLGGADSYQASTDRMGALVRSYAPQLQKIDDAAYDSAVNRATNTQNLISKNRSDTLGEIKGTYDAELDPTIKLLSGNDITNLANVAASGTSSAGAAATDADAMQRKDDKTAYQGLQNLLRAFNR